MHLLYFIIHRSALDSPFYTVSFIFIHSFIFGSIELNCWYLSLVLLVHLCVGLLSLLHSVPFIFSLVLVLSSFVLYHSLFPVHEVWVQFVPYRSGSLGSDRTVYFCFGLNSFRFVPFVFVPVRSVQFRFAPSSHSTPFRSVSPCVECRWSSRRETASCRCGERRERQLHLCRPGGPSASNRVFRTTYVCRGRTGAFGSHPYSRWTPTPDGHVSMTAPVSTSLTLVYVPSILNDQLRISTVLVSK